MIIKKIEVEGFGKFTNKAFDFNNGLNLIYGHNEDGKTTLMSFIKMMFYSSSSKTEKAIDLFKSLRKKYRPWNGDSMSGTIEFETNGMTYRLQKEFLKSEASDKTNIFCITTGENIQIENKNDAGEYFFGMNLEEFERSIFIGQNGGFTADSTGDSLAMRISNLSVSGDENISQDLILKRLSSAAEELVSKSHKKGLLVEAEKRLEELQMEKQKLLQLEEDQKDIEIHITKLSAEIQGLENDLNALSDSEKIESAKKELNAFYTLHNKLNLLKAVKGQLAVYNATTADMEKYADSAKELNQKIEDSLAIIQETSSSKNITISDEEYSKLTDLDKKCTELRQDLGVIRERITALELELADKTKTATRLSQTIAASVLGISAVVSVVSYLLLPYGTYMGIGILGIGIILFISLLLTAKKRALSKFTVQLVKRDIDGAIRGLCHFDESMIDKSATLLESEFNAKLSDAVWSLSQGLSLHGIGSVSELKTKSAPAQAENIKALTEELMLQKEQFIALGCTIKPISTFSAAKILFVELCESLSKFKSLSNEIETICAATGITDTSEDFVSGKIKSLGEFIQNAPKTQIVNESSHNQIRIELGEKRALLNKYQAQIKHPERNISEVTKEIKLTMSHINDLKQRFSEINLAIEVMNEAILDTNKGLGSHLSKKVSEYLAKISGGKYTDVLVPRDLSLETRSQNSQTFHEWKYLSSGAIDRIYLALRLAMTDILAEKHETLPLFLDDILSQYDDDACETSLKFLKEYFETSGSVSQMIFFTCHKNILDLAKNIFDDAKEISL
ncbi:MAG: AAA family ATPase [Clostridia bacterium]|nr:AAA family ATPase [Clostridia bacterium]